MDILIDQYYLTYRVDIQCAAVTTQSGAIRDPPQLNDFELPLKSAIYK